MRKEIDAALGELTGDHRGARDEAVHEARKSLKKVRAVLRLVRPVVGEKGYRRENTCFRDAGRPLSVARDAQILVQTVEQLIGQVANEETDRPFAAMRPFECRTAP